MPVTVKHDHSFGEGPQLPHEPGSIDESGPDALGECFCRCGILHEMVMERHDPSGTGILLHDGIEGLCLKHRHDP